MKRVILLLSAFALGFSVLTYGSYAEENVAPEGFDQKHENVEYAVLHQFKYYSKTAEQERPVNVFVPKNYDPNKKYPVLYLLHGIGGNEWEWLGGAPNEIISNLVAKKIFPETIVVIPNVRVRHKSVVKEPPFFSVEHFREFDAFLDEYQTSLKPEIESRYSIAPGRESRAIAGLSMGGRESLHLGIKLCPEFAYIGAFEPAPGLLPYPDENSLFDENSLTLPDEYKNSTYIFISKGNQDNVVRDWPQKYAETLSKNGVDPHFIELQGGHDFKVWKESLYRFANAIFKSNDNRTHSKGKTLFQLTVDNINDGRHGLSYGKFSSHNDTIIRCEIAEHCQNPWDVGLRYTLNRPIQKGEILALQFKAKTLTAQTESGLCKIRVFFELNQPPYTKFLYRVAEIGRETREYSFPIVCSTDQAAGMSAFGVFMGDLIQTLDISDIKLTSYGVDSDSLALIPDTIGSYEGSTVDAPWRTAALKRIEKIRKGNLKITVIDQAGSTVPGAKISIRQTRSEFLWGTCVVAGMILDQSEDGIKYRDFLEKYCNVVVFENDLKWFGWSDPRSRENVMKACDWFDEHNIAVRGHNLVWPGWRNSDNSWRKMANDPEKLRQTVRAHILDETKGMKGRLIDWDVVNEPYDNRDIWEILGKEEIAEWFKIARQGDPEARLFLNDYGILTSEGLDKKKQDFYYQMLKELVEGGVPLGGIGMQGHFGSEATPPERVIEIIERFASLGLPIAITEHDIDSTNAKYQAEYTRDFMTAVFSCESVTEFLIWGFWARAHWRPNAAYMSEDWNLTPAGKVWTDLVSKEWRTNIDIESDLGGEARTRVFKGDYTIEVQNGSQTGTAATTVSQDGAEVIVQIK